MVRRKREEASEEESKGRRGSRGRDRDRGKKDKGKTEKTTTRIVTGICRSSYMFCTQLETVEPKEGGSGKTYKKASTRILIPKRDKKTIRTIEAAIKRAAIARFGNDVKVKSRKFSYPLRDGDEELEDGELEGKEYENHYFMNSKCYDRLPKVVGPDAVPIEDTEELEDVLVSGYHFRFSITLKAFDNESKGVRVDLNNIMFIKEGERLDGNMDAEDEFADYAEDSGGGDYDDD